MSGIRIPFRMLAQGTIIGAVALGVLKALGSTLLGGATSNPLLAGFAVIIGLLIWFNLVCQVILIGAAWIAVSASDAGLDLRGRAARCEKGKAEPDRHRGRPLSRSRCAAVSHARHRLGWCRTPSPSASPPST